MDVLVGHPVLAIHNGCVVLKCPRLSYLQCSQKTAKATTYRAARPSIRPTLIRSCCVYLIASDWKAIDLAAIVPHSALVGEITLDQRDVSDVRAPTRSASILIRNQRSRLPRSPVAGPA